MIRGLTYQATFARTGRTLAANLSFETGLTAITGPNEAGKSFVIEMIRWLLFGSDALRGTADDYAALEGTLIVSVKTQLYAIHRTPKGGKLLRGPDLLATGTRPINAKVIEILGFDLEVFDIACAANQGDIEKLAGMRPAERKRMVDRVIGADRIEEMAKWAGDQATLVGREIAILERNLSEPLEPVAPERYRPAREIADEVKALRGKQQRLHELYGWLTTKPPEPTLPEAPGVTIPMASLLAAEGLYQRHAYAFNPVAVAAQWRSYDLWQERVAFEKAHPRPLIGRDEAETILHVRDLKAQIVRLAKSPILTCPCGKPFTMADEAISAIRSDLVRLGEVDDRHDPHAALRMIQDWDDPRTQASAARLADAVQTDAPSVSRVDLQKAQTHGSLRIEDRTATLAELGVPFASLEAVRDAIRSLRIYEARIAAYEPARAAYEAWRRKAVQVTAEIEQLEAETHDLAQREAALAGALAYEALLVRHAADLAAYDARCADLAVKREERASWQHGKAGFNTLRDTIKTHLVPSLSKAASGLLSQMTGGARNAIVVDEAFDVTVDGQPIATLSGSGKACANLALRIGLGQVLTNNMLSIFIGDEIDASMDEERAENIQSSLAMLQSRISQIIIITHKVPQADHVISLGSVGSG